MQSNGCYFLIVTDNLDAITYQKVQIRTQNEPKIYRDELIVNN